MKKEKQTEKTIEEKLKRQIDLSVETTLVADALLLLGAEKFGELSHVVRELAFRIKVSVIEGVLRQVRENYTPKDQVQAECEKYLDDFKSRLNTTPLPDKFTTKEKDTFVDYLQWIYDESEDFKKEQREHD